MTGFDVWQRERRLASVRAAESRLGLLGYQRIGDHWVGLLGPSATRVRLILSREFPDALPEISLVDSPRSVVPHVERTLKLCLASGGAVSIDARRPSQIVDDALALATKALAVSDEARPGEIEGEFSAYWSEDLGKTDSIILALAATMPRRSMHARLRVEDREYEVVASSEDVVRDWCKKTTHELLSIQETWIVSGPRGLVPPAFSTRFTLQNFMTLVGTSSGSAERNDVQEWLSRQRLPCKVWIRVPTGGGPDDFALVGIAVPELAGRSLRGFRDARAIPTPVAVARATKLPVGRLAAQRADARFLVKRAGGDAAVLEKSVALVGCGAIGSHLAATLAGSGIGDIRLIDGERLGIENVHRHALGADDVDRFKAGAVRDRLRARYPWLSFSSVDEPVQDLLRGSNARIVVGADIVVVAIGDETIERQLNEFLHQRVPRVHVWIEPRGVGGHVLYAPKKHPGCLACLYRPDEQFGLANRASLLRPGQQFQTTMAGCAGTFAPFGIGDAQRAAVECAREVLWALTANSTSSRLTSWIVGRGAALAAGLVLSARANRRPDGTLWVEDGYADPNCVVCGEQRDALPSK